MIARDRAATSALGLALSLAIAAGACGGPAPASVVASSAATSSSSSALPMPTAYRGRRELAVKENAACVRCHADVAREWSASLHHAADTEPAYRVSFEIEPLPFCRGCHAPEGDADEEESADVRELGVGCVTCHVTEPGTVLAAPRAAPAPGRPSPHRVVRDARFAGVGACAGCHEFAFPGRDVRGVEDLMQGTIAEHAASPARDRACADCHMPRGEGARRGHGFVVSRDAAAVRKAVHVRAERVDATHVRISLTPNELGHAFPTGDLFRRLELAAWPVADPSKRAVRYLARHFGAEAAGLGRQLLSDDRVRGDGATITLELADADGAIGWCVRYQRVAHPNGLDERQATLEGELEVAAGTLE